MQCEYEQQLTSGAHALKCALCLVGPAAHAIGSNQGLVRHLKGQRWWAEGGGTVRNHPTPAPPPAVHLHC